MKRFKNILVGVDLSQGDHFVSDVLPAPTREAIERALWLAKLNSATVTFLYAIDASPVARRLIQESDGGDGSVVGAARKVLKPLVDRAAAEGLSADVAVPFGKSWVEIIRQVLRNRHDLVIAGTRHQGAVRGMLMGSTGIKLLRKCPCPVWITQPQPERQIKSILVAHCLRPVGDLAMELGCSMAQHHGAQLHVVHSLLDEIEGFLPGEVVLSEKIAQLRSNAERHIDVQLEKYQLAQTPKTTVITDSPDVAILDRIEHERTNLLVMGTLARTGISGPDFWQYG